LTGSTKYTITVVDGSSWLVYLIPAHPSLKPNLQQLSSSSFVLGSGSFTGIIQIAKLPRNNPKASLLHDQAAGRFAVGAKLASEASGNTASYTISWKTEGIPSRQLLSYALPHHVQSMPTASHQLQDISLQTTVKGAARAMFGDSMTLVETNLANNIGFGPWSVEYNETGTCIQNQTVQSFIQSIVAKDIDMDLEGKMATHDSIYWGGKVSFSR